MDENLVGYLLGALDEPTAREMKAYVESPVGRRKFALLREAIEPLQAEAGLEMPPPGLLQRTLDFVAQHSDLPKAPTVRSESLAPASWWRRADVLVAACILVAVSGLLIPAVWQLRTAGGAASIAACQNNLRQFFVALQTYRETHGRYPDLEAEAPRNVAGMVIPILVDAGVLPDSASVRCPGNGPHVACQVTLASLRTMSPEEFDSHAPSLSRCYAYSLGYRDNGQYHSAVDASPLGLSVTPVMADRVAGEETTANSPNHDGRGQNLLFLDGHVRFASTRNVGADDVFVNRENHVAAGVGASDFVLGYSAARP